MSITARNLEQAAGGPLRWPPDPCDRILYYLFVRSRLVEMFGAYTVLDFEFVETYSDRVMDAVKANLDRIDLPPACSLVKAVQRLSRQRKWTPGTIKTLDKISAAG